MDNNKNNKNNKICSNCGIFGHEFKFCKNPITSWGIITVKKKENGIKFLLIRRKHSLGYIEFIRGRYKPENITGIMYLFKQMTPSEINKIKSMQFDELWANFWDGDCRNNMNINKEYKQSKDNFTQLQNNVDVKLDLNFYLNTHTMYNEPEWGFPKGRKNKNESDIDCAIREFCEETGYNEHDIKLINQTASLIENMTGTNGVEYRHIYYLAEDKTDIIPSINDKNKNEVGDIGYFTYDETMAKLRDYHIEKKNIATTIFKYYLEKTNFLSSEQQKSVWTDEIF